MREPDQRHKGRRKMPPQWLFVIVMTMMLIIGMTTFASYGFLRVATRGRIFIPSLPAQLLAAYMSFLMLYTAFKCVIWGMHRHLAKTIDQERRTRVPLAMTDAMDALDRISHGDFDVLLEEEADGRHMELSARINSMAESLRSMEHMRQDFVSNVSHEIQSPLTSIAGFAALLRQEDLSPAQRAHYIDIIETESKRLSRLSDNLLRLSLLDSDGADIAREPFRLDRQLEDIFLSLEPQWAQKNIAPDLSLERVELSGDSDLLSHVWTNLLHNAIKFTPEGGAIAIRLRVDDACAVCEIADTGIGIPEENLMHIFERFYKVDKARDRSLGGNGLGLSLVKRIVEQHGGEVSVRSGEGEGSTFSVTLPL